MSDWFETRELTIARVGLEGQGVGVDEAGNITFVPGALPGDRVRVSVAANAKRYRDGVLLEIVEPSPDRREPECERFLECGGCDWLHWDYEAQLRGKTATLDHVLERAGWEPAVVHPFLGAEEARYYRNRIQVRSENGRLGFLKRKSNDIVDIEKCVVARPEINEALLELRAKLQGEEGRHKYELALHADGEVEIARDLAHAAAGGFAQVHAGQNEKLIQCVSDMVAKSKAKKVLELFAGDGNLTFGYAASVTETFAVDSSSVLVQRGRDRAAPNVVFLESFVSSPVLRKMPPEFRNAYDTLIVDPPRSGVESGLEPFLHPKLNSVIYVSCSPLSFTRDTQCLKKDFVLSEVQGIDMFPQTRHIEFVARFSRR